MQLVSRCVVHIYKERKKPNLPSDLLRPAIKSIIVLKDSGIFIAANTLTPTFRRHGHRIKVTVTLSSDECSINEATFATERHVNTAGKR